MKIANYYKGIILFILIFTICVACSTDSSERREIVEWASQIARIEKQIESEIIYYQPLLNRIASRPPTSDELDQLTEYSDRIKAQYIEISKVSFPPEARSVHVLFIENYAKISDTARYYVMAIMMNDQSYYAKSVIAAEEASRTGNDAFNAFENLLDEYSISCAEIDLCE